MYQAINIIPIEKSFQSSREIIPKGSRPAHNPFLGTASIWASPHSSNIEPEATESSHRIQAIMSPYFQEFDGWWKCCGCKQPVNPKVHNQCPECQHSKCNDCKEMGQSPTPSPEPQPEPEPEPEPDSDTELQYQEMGGHYYTHCPQLVTNHDEYHGHGGGYYQADPSYVRYPPLAGWWECGLCGGPVNPGLNGWVCPVDDHPYCEYDCKIYTR